jgi:hypothetical protein
MMAFSPLSLPHEIKTKRESGNHIQLEITW